MCLEDKNCDAFEYKTEVRYGYGAQRYGVSSCSLIQLKNSIMMEYSFIMQHTGSVNKIVPTFDFVSKIVFWTDKVGIKKSWRGRIIPIPNQINTVGLGHDRELTELDEIHQLQHHGQCCEYLSVRFSGSSDDSKPHIFSINHEVKTHIEYLSIGKVISIIEFKKRATN